MAKYFKLFVTLMCVLQLFVWKCQGIQRLADPEDFERGLTCGRHLATAYNLLNDMMTELQNHPDPRLHQTAQLFKELKNLSNTIYAIQSELTAGRYIGEKLLTIHSNDLKNQLVTSTLSYVNSVKLRISLVNKIITVIEHIDEAKTYTPRELRVD